MAIFLTCQQHPCPREYPWTNGESPLRAIISLVKQAPVQHEKRMCSMQRTYFSREKDLRKQCEYSAVTR